MQPRRSIGVINSSFHADVPNELDRAIQMLYTYPIMKVGGTAFENNTYNQQVPTSLASPPETPAPPLAKENSTSLPARENYTSISGEVMDNVIKESFNEDGNPRFGQKPRDGMVRLAHALKQAAMWQTILVTVLSHETLMQRFRYLKLQQALERHLLPTLLHRKEETGSIINKNYKSQREAAAKLEELAERPPEGSYLKERSEFFQSMNNSALLQAIADRMKKVRFASGEIIARPEDVSQHAMYFVVTGKCEVRRDEITADGEGVKTTTKVMLPGDKFGGIFNTNAVYGATYRTLSMCSMWKLRADDFESVFQPFADKTMMNVYITALRKHATEWLARAIRWRRSSLASPSSVT
ncbi:hypothetical protein STCU_11684 [Strigomonas culicis]|uniref:Cyclic nucleotide-binding domain-containing protein n=1 Tax=Strigomonas culicis TaxID=28005 RepID=S9UMG1_9TRYP|nr:hypothetical protein STCU_11684 [Strigomonas culicis]|eukprot:EPY15901.1 hypothetical protein STCU_11684 [Strigomonas culicis]